MSCADPLVGRLLDSRYRLGEPIGEGAFGRIYEARQAGSGRRVAVKVLQRERRLDLRCMDSFDREIRAARRLSHPNVARLLDHGVTPEGLTYFAMELVRGISLSSLIEDGERFGPKRVVHLFTQILSALEAAHRAGVVHGDVKPLNMLISHDQEEQEQIKMIDFGVAQIISGPGAQSSDTIAGTPVYVPPEVILGHPSTPRSDLYSLGVTLYEVLTGQVPYDDPRTGEVLRLHLEGRPRDPERLRPDVPRPLARIALRAMARSPADRYQSAEAMQVALAAAGRLLAPTRLHHDAVQVIPTRRRLARGTPVSPPCARTLCPEGPEQAAELLPIEDYLEQSRLHAGRGELNLAIVTLEQGVAEVTLEGALGPLDCPAGTWELLRELAMLERRRGDPDRARRWARAASRQARRRGDARQLEVAERLAEEIALGLYSQQP